MSILDDVLVKYNLKYEDLRSDERETLNVWLQALQQGQLTLEKVKSYVTGMRESIEQEVTKVGLTKEQDLFLKARLRNYILLEGFLSTPEKAKEQLDRAISSFASNIK